MKYILILICVYLLAYILTPVFQNYFQIKNLAEPVNKSYSSDEVSFLKTYYLMKKGLGYYPAFQSARANLSTEDDLSSDTSRWRMPTIFWIWNLFAPGGNQILTLFIFLSFLGITSIYLLIKIEHGVIFGILSVLGFLPYLYDSFSYGSAFLFMEWWGLWLLVLGLTAYFYQRNILAIFFLSLALLTRELLLIPVIFLAIYSFHKNQRWQIFMICIAIFFIGYLFHWMNINAIVDHKNQTNFLDRIHQFNLINLQTMSSFSMRRYVVEGLKTHYLVLVLGTLSVILNSFIIKSKVGQFILLLIITSLVIYPMISFRDNDYWGILFIPFIIIYLPLVLNKAIYQKLKII